jgi:hypothetical protein
MPWKPGQHNIPAVQADRCIMFPIPCVGLPAVHTWQDVSSVARGAHESTRIEPCFPRALACSCEPDESKSCAVHVQTLYTASGQELSCLLAVLVPFWRHTDLHLCIHAWQLHNASCGLWMAEESRQ